MIIMAKGGGINTTNFQRIVGLFFALIGAALVVLILALGYFMASRYML